MDEIVEFGRVFYPCWTTAYDSEMEELAARFIGCIVFSLCIPRKMF